MAKQLTIHPYHSSIEKQLLDKGFSLAGLFFLFPLFLLIGLVIKLTSNGSVFFLQKRMGKNGHIFNFIKFRIMDPGADSKQASLGHLNESDGPVFKIDNDPRFVGPGRFLAKTGLDELPQLINVLKGEMSLVGPRPLPVSEAKKLTKSQRGRQLVTPGMTSTWVVGGAHKLPFKQWMILDQEYVAQASLSKDINILIKTVTGIFEYLGKAS